MSETKTPDTTTPTEEDTLDFTDLKPVEVPFTLPASVTKAKDGRDRPYVLREASADAVRQYENARTAGARLSSDGKTAYLGAVGNVKPLLVQLCTFELYESKPGSGDFDKERPVTPAQVAAWPGRIVERLFDRAKAISGLGDKPAKPEGEPRGNGQTSSDDGEGTFGYAES